MPKCFPNVPYNDWVSVHKNVFHVEQEEEEEKEEEEDRAMNNGSRSTKNETYIFTPDTPSLRRSRHDEKAKDLFFKKEREKSESGGLGTTILSEKEARKIWHEKQMLLDKKKKKIKVNGKVFHRGEVPEKDIFGDAWKGKVDGSDDDEKNQSQMFAKSASFKTCAVVSSGAALKGKGTGKRLMSTKWSFV